MKSKFWDVRSLTLPALLLIISGAACKKNEVKTAPPVPPPPPISQCHLISQVDSFGKGTYYFPGVTYDRVEKYGYSYDAMGNMTGSTDSAFLQYSDGTKAVAITTSSSEYDPSGYCTKAETKFYSKDRTGVIQTYDVQLTYQYDGGRLVKASTSSITNGNPSAHSSDNTYAYDAAGNLIRYISPYDSVTYTYTNGALTRIDQMDYQKHPHVFTIQTNADGAILKLTGDNGRELDCQYDANGNMVDYQDWENGAETFFRTSTYDNMKVPLLIPPAKGFPKDQYVTPYISISITAKNNLTTTSAKVFHGNQFEQSTFTNTYDSNGNLILQTNATTGAGQGEEVVIKSVYTYSGCP